MKWFVNLIESEQGWGQKLDKVREFDTKLEADNFVKEFNAKNNEEIVPDWYMYAQSPYQK